MYDIPGRKKRRSGGVWKFLLFVVLVLGLGRLALPFAVEYYVEDRLAASPDYAGEVDDVDINLWRGAYEVEGLRVLKVEGGASEPYFSADKVDFSVDWSELFNGVVVGEVVLHKPILNIVGGKKEQKEPPKGWKRTLEELFPFELDQVLVRDGEVHFRNPDTKPGIDLYLKNVSARLANLTNVEGRASGLPATLSAKATVMEHGNLRLQADINPFASLPEFDLAAAVSDVRIPELNAFLRSYANFDAEQGLFDAHLEAKASKGTYAGFVRPSFDGVEVFRWKEDLEDTPLGGIVEELTGRAEGFLKKKGVPVDLPRSRVDVGGKFAPGTDLAEGIGTVLRDAFLKSFVPQLEKAITG